MKTAKLLHHERFAIYGTSRNLDDKLAPIYTTKSLHTTISELYNYGTLGIDTIHDVGYMKQ